MSLPLLMVFCLVLSLMPGNIAFADANKLYITPASSQMTINTTFTVNVRTYADSDQSTGTANGTVTYPTSQLQVTSISTSGSGYGAPSISQGSGTIGFTASRNPAPSGNTQLFAITFRTVGSGTAVVGFTADSKVNSVTTTYNSGVYTITNPNPNPSPSSTPKPTTTPKPTPVPIVSTPEPTPAQSETPVEPTPDPTGVVDEVSVTPLYTTATVTWKVNAANSTSTLSYGPSTAQLDKKATVVKKADGTFSASISGLSPGTRYMFTIAASGSAGKSGNYTGSIPTRGYPVTITVTENNVPVESGQIKIGNQSSYISSSGKVTLGLAAGSYSGTITTSTASISINLTVEVKAIPSDGNAPESQNFAYNLSSSVLEQGPGSGNSVLTFIAVMGIGLVILGLAFVGFIVYRRRRFESGDDVIYKASEAPSVIIDDGYNWQGQPPQNEANPPKPDVTSLPTSTEFAPTPHHNSVYLSEDEPLDMFEQASKKLPLPPAHHPTDDSGATGQTPSSPHSTTP